MADAFADSMADSLRPRRLFDELCSDFVHRPSVIARMAR